MSDLIDDADACPVCGRWYEKHTRVLEGTPDVAVRDDAHVCQKEILKDIYGPGPEKTGTEYFIHFDD